ncbi:MAG TPA: hypothetical protein DCE78_03675, partial [Bacteroidetes bacterium]|nr:hypothetical protein [Bacteroidota bacterium]
MKRLLTTIQVMFLLLIATNAYGQNVVNVTDASINAGDIVYWTADNVYVLDGMVFVEDGAELWI